ncbi:MAG: peptidase [Alphaproteobacteria bacterium]|nr:peptidase [Alphaproteobacteria bacterium]MCW5743828.1 peptidase [Alphaproteobacteria bacterium]
MTDSTPTTQPANVLADARETPPPAKEEPHAPDAAAAQAEIKAADVEAPEVKGHGVQPQREAPLTYADFTLPEGVEVDAETLSEARTLLGEMKLPQEQAQRLVDFYAGKMRRLGEAQAESWVKLNEKWVGDFKTDREIGGDRIQETVAAATRAMDRFGTPGLREALIMTGAGNHPEVIRFVARVGRATAEDRFVAAAGASAGAARSAAEVLYPARSDEE